MPMYDYRCNSCDMTFEELVFSSSTPDEEIECPGCGEKNAQKLLSAPMISTGSASTATTGVGGCNARSGFS